jgi:hypothetical protein
MPDSEQRIDPEGADDPGQLVVIQARVVENADHVFGNLFQRLYYGASQVGDYSPLLAEELTDSARQVEGALQLLLDYIAPFPPLLERFAVADLARSLAQRVEGLGSLRVSLALGDASGSPQVRVDPSRLGRAFDLMLTRLGGQERGAAAKRATVGIDVGPANAVVWLRLPDRTVEARTSIGELRWAVAAKLVEIHGGSLEEAGLREGEVLWKVSLPREP